MPNNIANKLEVKAKTQTEIENFLSAITSVDGDETLQIDFEKIVPMPECVPETLCDDEHQEALYYYLITTGNENMVDKLLSYPQFFSMIFTRIRLRKSYPTTRCLEKKSLTSHNNVDQLIGTIGDVVTRVQNGTHTKQTLVIVVMVV